MQGLSSSSLPTRSLTNRGATLNRWQQGYWKNGDGADELKRPTHSELSGNETILVVDDEPLVREVIVKILRRFGYRVLEASGIMEAQRWTKTDQKINLLLTDFAMAETNGLELARWFQRQCPELKVLITTGSLWELANQISDGERIVIMAKPFDYLQLSRIVRMILG